MDEDTLALPSERAFGWLFTVVFAAIAAWQSYAGREPFAAVFAVAALAVGTITLAAPRRLAPVKRLWLRLGRLLHAVVSPLVLFAMYAVLIIPLALVMRLIRRDSLKLRFDANAATYWIDRVPPGPPPESFTRQF